MRLRTYVTPPIAGGYVVECDLRGSAKKKRFKADMGVINSRYRMMAMGVKKKLRIESWAAIPRVRFDVPFNYDADTWYTMKFAVELDGNQARLRGKIWPRGEAEPTDWMIDEVDPCPNREGSAGLYCYSTNTTSKSDGPDTYYDNLKVYRHE
jgi:outer membrane protein assembly factor BamB